MSTNWQPFPYPQALPVTASEWEHASPSTSGGCGTLAPLSRRLPVDQPGWLDQRPEVSAVDRAGFTN